MKQNYKEYNRRNKEDLIRLWETALISFDTNILLDLYRNTPFIFEKFIEFTEGFHDRVFLTHQVGLEYSRKRFDIINENIKVLDNKLQEISSFETKTKELTYYKYLSEKIKQDITKEIQTFKSKIADRKKSLLELNKNDIIYEKLDAIFSNSIEQEFKKNDYGEIITEGIVRYASNIPPGSEDKDKERGNPYGDLLIWKSLIRKSKTSKKPIIFVTNEKKNDWVWTLKDGTQMGTHPELVKEMCAETGFDFTTCDFENFFRSGCSPLKKTIDFDKLKKEFVFESIFETPLPINLSNHGSPNRLGAIDIAFLINEKSNLEKELNLLRSSQLEAKEKETKTQQLSNQIAAINMQINAGPTGPYGK